MLLMQFSDLFVGLTCTEKKHTPVCHLQGTTGYIMCPLWKFKDKSVVRALTLVEPLW